MEICAQTQLINIPRLKPSSFVLLIYWIYLTYLERDPYFELVNFIMLYALLPRSPDMGIYYHSA